MSDFCPCNQRQYYTKQGRLRYTLYVSFYDIVSVVMLQYAVVKCNKLAFQRLNKLSLMFMSTCVTKMSVVLISVDDGLFFLSLLLLLLMFYSIIHY